MSEETINKIDGSSNEQQANDWASLMSDEDRAGYEKWNEARKDNPDMPDFEGEHYRGPEGNKFIYHPIQKGEHANVEYKARLEWEKLAEQKAAEFPWTENDILFDENGKRDHAKEQAEWRKKAGMPTYEEYLADFKKRNGYDEVDTGTEAEDTTSESDEDDPTESYWHKLSKEGRRELMRKHRRRMGEKTVEWARRIEEEEGRKIFSADLGVKFGEDEAKEPENNNPQDPENNNPEEGKDKKPTQDDLSYEAWLRSNANPAFETDRDGNPNRFYTGEQPDGPDGKKGDQEAKDSQEDQETKDGQEDQEAKDGQETKDSQEDQEDKEAAERKRLMRAISETDIERWLKEDKNLLREDYIKASNKELQALLDEYNAQKDKKPGPDGPKPDAKKPEQKTPDTPKRLSREDLNTIRSLPFVEAVKTGKFEELAETLSGHLDKARNFDDISVAWKEIDALLESCDDDVKNTIAYRKALSSAHEAERSWNQTRNAFRQMPTFTLPWGKMHDRKESLRADMKTRNAGYRIALDRLDDARAELPDSVSDEDNARADTIWKMYMRSMGIHSENNVRDRLTLIARNEKELQANKGSSEYENRMRSEIQSHRKEIEDYQKDHPDFVLTPDENYVNPHYDSENEVESDDYINMQAEGFTVAERAQSRHKNSLARVEQIRQRAREAHRNLYEPEQKEIERLNNEAQKARKILLTERGVKALPEGLQADWRKDIKGAANSMELNQYDEAYNVVASLNENNDEQARRQIVRVMDEYADEFMPPFFDKLSKYGGDKGKALAEEYRKKLEEQQNQAEEPELLEVA